MTAFNSFDFLVWFSSAKAGDTFTYHVGTNLGCPEADENAVDMVRQFYNEGKIELVQRAIGAANSKRLRDFEYLAVKRSAIARRTSFLDRIPQVALAA